MVVRNCKGSAGLENNSEDVANPVRLGDACLGVREPTLVVNPKDYRRYFAPRHVANG